MIEKTLAELSLNITDGKHGDCRGMANSGFYFISCKDVRDGQIYYDNARQILEEDFLEAHKRTKLEPDDILVTNSGTIGRMAFVRKTPLTYKTTFQKSVAIVKPDKSKILPKYLYYQLQNCVDGFVNQSNGAAQKNLLLSTMRAFKMYIHEDPNIQARIVGVLSAYDDLIENNQKQIKLLEEAAQRLYKEWFVDLRFPGYENTPITDGVPQGWNRKKVVDCLSFHGNGGWGKENPIGKNEHPGKVIRGTDIEGVKSGRFNEVPLRYHTDNDIAKRALKTYDLVFELSNGNINNIGRCLLIDKLILKNCGENTICASFCKLLRPVDPLHSLILYWEIQDMQISGRMLPLKKHGANGINNFDFDSFLNHELLVPDSTKPIKPINEIMKEISIIQGKITLLTEARDRLLPKLMRGELEV